MEQATEQAVEQAAKRGPGHPLEYDREALVPLICAQLSEGVPLRVICRQPGMPSVGQVHAWKRADPEIAEPITRAREEGYEAIVERARQTLRGKGPEEGGESTGDVQRDKEIANFDLKLLAKWSPGVWGDKVALTNHDGTSNPMLTLSAVLASELADLIDVTPRPEALPAPSDEPGGKGQ